LTDITATEKATKEDSAISHIHLLHYLHVDW